MMKLIPYIGLGLALATGAGAGVGNPDRGQPSRVPAVVRATGTLEPEQVVDVTTAVPGRVRQLGTDPADPGKAIGFGSVVKKGTVLARLDAAPYEAEVARARANVRRAEARVRLARARVALAEQEWRRAEKRAADKAGDAADVGVARAALDVARAAAEVDELTAVREQAVLAKAELLLGYTTIRSPIDGVVIDRRVNVGQAVPAGGPDVPSLFLLANPKRLQVWAAVKEADIGRVARGQLARFTVDAFPRRTFQGRVLQVRLNATQTKGEVTYTVVIGLDNRDGGLLPYLTADVRIEVGGRKDGR
jgi:HlyD family secretion protein